MVHLRSAEVRPGTNRRSGFPFDTPLLRALKKIEFRTPVTFFVGENGAGKSLLLESIAAAAKAVAVGGHDLLRAPTLQPARELGKCLKLVWKRKACRGFFLRAEDFFGFTRRIRETIRELDETSEEFGQKFKGYARALAQGAVRGQREALVSRYGEDLDANSHGESFLKLFRSRFVPGGLYLLDEPEAPLSPSRQLTLMTLLKDMVDQDSQFIIATHSPILMAFPGAAIYSFDKRPPKESPFEELEHVWLLRRFLADPQSFLSRLFDND